jgi:anaerobic selenocysteine-containing dehydrogenase
MVARTLVKGCCPLDCQDTCSWVAHVEDGRVTAVRGAKDHPFTRGVLCAKVNDYEARTYAGDRLLHPLRRVGRKGSTEFERISWDEAVDTIAGRFSRIIDEYGGMALLPHRYLGSMGIVQRHAPMRLMNALGASRTHGGICSVAAGAVENEGFALGFDPEDFVHSGLILLWGTNLLSTAHHHWHFIDVARRNGARVVCIDPLRTRTARQCDQHIAVRPGSDTALAAGIAHVLFRDGLADLTFARSVIVDLDAYRSGVAPWTPDCTASVCGIRPKDVEDLASTFASARPAAIRAGVGLQQSVGGEDCVRALAALSILGGHAQHRGGGLFVWAFPGLNEARADRADLGDPTRRSLDMARLGETLNDPDLDPPVKGLMVWCVNPAVTQPDAGLVRRGLAREDLFTVVIDHFLTDTARYADIVLPGTTQLEHFDIVGAWGHTYVSVNNPAIAPLGEAKSHGEIMRLLAARLRLDHTALRESDEEIAASALPDDVKLAALKGAGWIRRQRPSPTYGRTVSVARAVPETAQEGASRVEDLHLLTPKSHFFLNSSFANMARQQKGEGGPVLAMHPDDAGRRGLTDGRPVVIRNDRGSLRATLRVTDTVRPGVVALPGKWWGEPAEGSAVGNLLTPSAWSPSGQPAFNDVRVEVEPVRARSAEAVADAVVDGSSPGLVSSERLDVDVPSDQPRMPNAQPYIDT